MDNKPAKTEGARLLREKIEKLIRTSKYKLEQQEIAIQLGICPNTLCHWLAERRRPTIDQAVVVARMLKIKVSAWTQAPSQT